MTEMSPLGTLCALKPDLTHLTGQACSTLKVKQGHAPSASR